MPAGFCAFDDAHHRRHDRDNKEKWINPPMVNERTTAVNQSAIKNAATVNIVR